MGKKSKSKQKSNHLGLVPKKKQPKPEKKKHKWGEKRQKKGVAEEVPSSSTLAMSPVSKPKSEKSLRDKMLKRLQAAKFRQVNEELDNVTYDDPKEAFGSSEQFRMYHETYSERIKQWPEDPLNLIITWILEKIPKKSVIADFGCGEARLAASVPHTVHSFDLYSLNERVTACDMSNCPLPNGSVNVAVFCLSLMGIDIGKYIGEANRILKPKGILKIAEVASRFQNNSYSLFARKMKKFGFVSNIKTEEANQKNQNKTLHSTGEVFFMFEFTKVRACNERNGKIPVLKLNPSVYKRR